MARTPGPDQGGRPGRLRLFLALDLPPAARAGIARWRDSFVGERHDLRRVASDALHVTLIFLGPRPAEEVGEIWEATATAAVGLRAPSLAPAALVGLPRRRSRLWALELEDEGGRAATLHGALSGALESAGLHVPEARAFWAHVTLARARGRSRLGEPPDPPPQPVAPFGAPLLTLYRSDVRPTGARYVPLERLELEGAP